MAHYVGIAFIVFAAFSLVEVESSNGCKSKNTVTHFSSYSMYFVDVIDTLLFILTIAW